MFQRAITKNPQMTNIISAFDKLKTIILNNSTNSTNSDTNTETTSPKRKATEPAQTSTKK